MLNLTIFRKNGLSCWANVDNVCQIVIYVNVGKWHWFNKRKSTFAVKLQLNVCSISNIFSADVQCLLEILMFLTVGKSCNVCRFDRQWNPVVNFLLLRGSVKLYRIVYCCIGLFTQLASNVHVILYCIIYCRSAMQFCIIYCILMLTCICNTI